MFCSLVSRGLQSTKNQLRGTCSLVSEMGNCVCTYAYTRFHIVIPAARHIEPAGCKRSLAHKQILEMSPHMIGRMSENSYKHIHMCTRAPPAADDHRWSVCVGTHCIFARTASGLPHTSISPKQRILPIYPLLVKPCSSRIPRRPFRTLQLGGVFSESEHALSSVRRGN